MKIYCCNICGVLRIANNTSGYDSECNIGYVSFTNEPGVEDETQRCSGILVEVPADKFMQALGKVEY
jgi:hypothetical protein